MIEWTPQTQAALAGGRGVQTMKEDSYLLVCAQPLQASPRDVFAVRVVR